MRRRRWTYWVVGVACVGAAGVMWVSARFDEEVQRTDGAMDGGDLALSTPASARTGNERAESDSAGDGWVVDCGQLEDEAAVLLAQQRADLGDFHWALQGSENRLLTLELAAELAGYDPEAVRFGRVWLVGSSLEIARKRSPYPLPSLPGRRGAVPLDGDEAGTLLDTILREGEFERLRELRDVSVASRDSLGARHDTNLLGIMIRRHGADMTTWLPHVPEDWPIGVHELAVAIDAGVSAYDFEALLDLSSVDPRAGWRRPDPIREVNLAQVAAYHIRPAILRTLMAQGANAESDRQSVLDDILAESTSDHDSDEVQDVVRQLVAAGLKPRRPSALSILEARYPDLAGIGLGGDTTAVLASGAAAEAADRLVGIRSKWTAELDALYARAERCQPTPVADATSGWPDSATFTLREKERYDQWLLEQDEAVLRALVDGAPSRDEPLGKVSQVLRDGYESAIDGRWEEAIEAAMGVPPIHRSHLLTDLLSLSLRRGAPIEAIEELIRLNDGLLPEDAVLGLSERRWDGAVDVAKELIAQGLDIHYVDSFGRNAFSSLARSYPVNLEMAAFLAAHSVSPKPSPYGKDPLDLVLSRMVRMAAVGRTEFDFARLLVSIGAPVESSHRELAGRLALVDSEDYRKLVNAIPQLRNGTYGAN